MNMAPADTITTRRLEAAHPIGTKRQPLIKHSKRQRQAKLRNLNRRLWPLQKNGTLNPNPHRAGVFARKNVRTCRSASGIRSFGSFHGYKLTCAFGANRADSIATA
jgi:hypothetical protein